MNDDKQPAPDTAQAPRRTPNREYRRTPPVIEGEASSVRTEPSESPASGTSGEMPPETAAAAAESSPAVANAAPQTETSGPEIAGRGADAPPADAAPAGSAEESAAAGGVYGPPPAPEPEARQQRGYGFGAIAAASLGSAALAALAVFGVQTVNTPSGPAPAALETRIADVERRLPAGPQSPPISPAAITALEKRIASVEALANNAAETARKAAEAADRPAPAAQQGSDAASQALQALDDRIAALEKNATGAVSLLDRRLAAAEKALAAPKSEDRATETRIEPAPPPDLDPLRKQIAALESRLQSMEREAGPLAEAARAAQANLKGLEARLQPLAGQIEDVRARGDADRKRAESLAERSAEGARVALAQSLAAAVASGAPFAAQTESLARLGVSADQLAPLRDAAKTGVATNAELAREFAALEPKIVARAETSADATVIDRLANSAFGLVRVRPAGETTGDAPADVFARTTRALQNGDVAHALKEWEKLPDSARSASAEWAARARQRLAAEGAARALLSNSAQQPGRS